jgi:hypothetical protein
MTFEYEHEAGASESVFFESTHSLPLRACITVLFTYVVSIPKETEKRDTKTLKPGSYIDYRHRYHAFKMIGSTRR